MTNPPAPSRRSLVGLLTGGLVCLAVTAFGAIPGSPSLSAASARPFRHGSLTSETVTSAPVSSAPVSSAPVTSAPGAPVPSTSVPETSVPATSAPVTSVSPSDLPTETLLASRTVQGGRCITGLCLRRYRVYADGRWDYTDNTRSSDGRLSPEDLDAVEDAVVSTRIFDAAPFTGLCPTAWDGSEIVYVWVDDDSLYRESTCTREIPDTDPLVEVLERLVTDAQDAAEGSA